MIMEWERGKEAKLPNRRAYEEMMMSWVGKEERVKARNGGKKGVQYSGEESGQGTQGIFQTIGPNPSRAKKGLGKT